MKTAYDIILKPVISERSMYGIARRRNTPLTWRSDANKIEISQGG